MLLWFVYAWSNCFVKRFDRLRMSTTNTTTQKKGEFWKVENVIDWILPLLSNITWKMCKIWTWWKFICNWWISPVTDVIYTFLTQNLSSFRNEYYHNFFLCILHLCKGVKLTQFLDLFFWRFLTRGSGWLRHFMGSA